MGTEEQDPSPTENSQEPELDSPAEEALPEAGLTELGTAAEVEGADLTEEYAKREPDGVGVDHGNPEDPPAPAMMDAGQEAAPEPEVVVEPVFTASAGELLTEARERLGLGTVEVAEKLHLTVHYVRALEAGEYEKLPGEVYVKGYLRSYALLVGIDGEKVIAAYQLSGAPAANLNNVEPFEPEKVSRNWLWLVVIGLVAVGGIAAVFWALASLGAVVAPCAPADGRESGNLDI